MAVKAVFPTGESVTTTDTLHQWDYGQTLEIEAYDLPLIQEVHFACPEMTEALVRPCSTTGGVATVKIPDLCLEQTSPITAWVFVIDGTEGMTKKTITIPVKERTRPTPSGEGDVPVEVLNKYTELLSEINEAVLGLANGDITVAKAVVAGSAGTAGTAGSAGTAGHANTADNAPDKGTQTGEDDTEGQAFGFSNTNGFGVKGLAENGYFKVWNKEHTWGNAVDLVPSLNEKQNLGSSERKFKTVFAELFKGKADEAVRSDSATTADTAGIADRAKGAPYVEGENKAFTFGNLNGFGSNDPNVSGYFQIYHHSNGGDTMCCNLVPSLDGKQTFGNATKKLKAVYAENFYGHADTATTADKASGAPYVEGENKTFTFGNLNGFGSNDPNVAGHFQIHHHTNGEDTMYCNLEPSLNEKQIFGSSEKKLKAVYATNFYGHADSATTADKASGAPYVEGENKAFTFGNLNGFGSSDPNVSGYFQIYHHANGENTTYCNLVPSVDGKQTLGSSTKKLKAVYANNFHGCADTADALTVKNQFISYTSGDTLEVGLYAFRFTFYEDDVAKTPAYHAMIGVYNCTDATCVVLENYKYRVYIKNKTIVVQMYSSVDGWYDISTISNWRVNISYNKIL